MNKTKQRLVAGLLSITSLLSFSSCGKNTKPDDAIISQTQESEKDFLMNDEISIRDLSNMQIWTSKEYDGSILVSFFYMDYFVTYNSVTGNQCDELRIYDIITGENILTQQSLSTIDYYDSLNAARREYEIDGHDVLEIEELYDRVTKIIGCKKVYTPEEIKEVINIIRDENVKSAKNYYDDNGISMSLKK